ncbi:MAG: hypothetical protein DHS20C17_05170 [Cyclobacteriaceae bacterium]|nr:MAG: hypothetical protein DHS20C17_05170 [Cyclobacteriaceae bacterium]
MREYWVIKILRWKAVTKFEVRNQGVNLDTCLTVDAIGMRDELNYKILNGLERLSEAFKTMLWQKAKQHGISPIQIQILLFLQDHTPELCTVSQLANEFNLTKPTISDAVRVLNDKGMVVKNHLSSDSRSYSLDVSTAGKRLLKQLSDYADPLYKELRAIDSEEQQQLFKTLTRLIYNLYKNGTLSVQRICFGCRFYQEMTDSHYCNLLQKPLVSSEIRLDCPEYQENTN